MKYLLYLDLALAALGAATSVILAYVLLALWYNRDALPTIGHDLPRVGAVAVCALLLTAASAGAAYGVWRRRGWLWAGQGALLLLLPVLFAVVRTRLQGS